VLHFLLVLVVCSSCLSVCLLCYGLVPDIKAFIHSFLQFDSSLTSVQLYQCQAMEGMLANW